MNTQILGLKKTIHILLPAVAAFMLLQPIQGFAKPCVSLLLRDTLKTGQQRDGSHDFDFHFGNWRAHFRQLIHKPTGAASWIETDGAVTVRKVWDGRASLEEIEAGSAAAPFRGLTILLYNPQAHQWSQIFADSNTGTLSTPLIGGFKNGRGEFYDQETNNGKTTLVRFVWSDITANAYRLERCSSDDGGKTWEPNFAANLTRDK